MTTTKEHYTWGVTVTLEVLQRWSVKNYRRTKRYRQVRILDVDAGRTEGEARRRWQSIRGTVRVEEFIAARQDSSARWLWVQDVAPPPAAVSAEGGGA